MRWRAQPRTAPHQRLGLRRCRACRYQRGAWPGAGRGGSLAGALRGAGAGASARPVRRRCRRRGPGRSAGGRCRPRAGRRERACGGRLGAGAAGVCRAWHTPRPSDQSGVSACAQGLAYPATPWCSCSLRASAWGLLHTQVLGFHRRCAVAAQADVRPPRSASWLAHPKLMLILPRHRAAQWRQLCRCCKAH